MHQTTCPSCGNQVILPRGSDVQRAKCPHCNNALSISAAPADVVPAPPALQPADSPPPPVTLAAPDKRPKPFLQRISPAMWYGIMAGLLVGALVAIFLFAVKTDGAP